MEWSTAASPSPTSARFVASLGRELSGSPLRRRRLHTITAIAAAHSTTAATAATGMTKGGRPRLLLLPVPVAAREEEPALEMEARVRSTAVMALALTPADAAAATMKLDKRVDRVGTPAVLGVLGREPSKICCRATAAADVVPPQRRLR